MAGAGEGKRLLRGAKVYLHEKGKSNARITHIDIEGDISKIIKEGEITFAKGKTGGVFIALKKSMIERAERMLRKK